MYFYVFLAVFIFLHVFKKMFYESVKNVFYVFYLQINVFNIYAAN